MQVEAVMNLLAGFIDVLQCVKEGHERLLILYDQVERRPILAHQWYTLPRIEEVIHFSQAIGLDFAHLINTANPC